MNTKIYYYLIGALVISIISVLAFQNTPSQSQDTNIPVVIDTGSIIQTGIINSGSLITGSQNNPLVYTNTEYGFQLTLPEGWEDYKVFFYPVNKELQNSYSGFIGTITIALPTNESNRPGLPDPSKPLRDTYDNHIRGYAEMFNIRIWSPEGYNKEQQRCTHNPDPSCMSVLNLLGNNNYYYFTSIGLGDMPTDLYNKRGNGETQKYITPIFKSLK